MKALLKILLSAAILFHFSCIEEYSISSKQNINEHNAIVIQGQIFSGEKSKIYISKTEPLNSVEQPEPISNAKVYVIGENGYKSEIAQYDTDGKLYLIDTETLPNNTSYAILVNVNGEVFQSDFLTLQNTPEIDNLTYKEKEDGVSIHISTHNTHNESRYYMWAYEEDWEFHAPIDFLGIKGIPVYNKILYNRDIINGHNPYLYCWKHTNSSNIFIYETENLQENAVKDVELIKIPINDIRISYIYSILVKQFCLDKNAYNYYKTLELYTEKNNSLFTPMPNELRGNVKCTSNAQIKVYGYVLASNIKTKRIFIYASDFKEIYPEYEDNQCIFLIPDDKDNSWYHSWSEMVDKSGAIVMTTNGSFSPFSNTEYLDSKLYSRECVDCRTVKGSTKQRPDFWPNNHE